MDQKKAIIILISSLAASGCVPFDNKISIKFKESSVSSNLKLDISSVQVQNNQLIVRGSGLKNIKTIKLINNGVTENLVVESATSGQLVANGLSTVVIGVGKIFDMVLADAHGSATVPVSFTLENGSITAAHLSDMGAVSGQVLKYNGTSWEPSTLSSSQVYLGVWNAFTNTPDLSLTSPVSGEYYIVSVAGTYNSVAYDLGDWIIHNGTSWDKVTSSAGTKLPLSGGTLTGNLQLDTLLKFKGAANYVTLKASASQASDIILTLPKTPGTSGQFLTTDGTGVMSWTTPADPVIANLDASKIADGSVSNAAFQYLAGVSSNIQAQLNAKQATGNFVTALTGDVTASGAGSVAATVATVGGVTAANIAAGASLANAATNANTASTIIKRDASGNFSAGIITGTFNGNATNVTGTVAVANGGTGNTTLGLNQLLFGNGTSAINGLTTTAMPSVLLSTVATGAPTWTTSTSGNVLKGSVSGVSFGALDLSDLPAGALSGAGTTNYIPYYNTTNTLANSPMAISGTNVGIGTTTPGSTFDISSVSPSLRISNPNVTISDFSTAGFSPTLGANTTAQWVNYSNTTGGYQLAGFTKSGTNNGVPAALVGYHGGTAPTTAATLLSGWKWNGATTRAALGATEIVTQVANATTPLVNVLGSGNVGIGTLTPNEKLDVYAGAIRASRNLLQYAYLSGGDEVNQHIYLRGISTGGNRKSLYLQSFNDGTGTAAGSNGFQFQTGTVASPLNVMTILESGRVGIGTMNAAGSVHVAKTSPTGKINSVASEISGVGTNFTTAFSVGDQIVSEGQVKTITAITDATNLTVNSAFAADLVDVVYSRVGAILDAGNVGVGTGSPVTKLDVQNKFFQQQRLWNTDSAQQLWMGSVANPVGSYIGNNAHYDVSYKFKPNYTSASGINFRQDGSTEFWNDTGLTSGTSYLPAKRVVITNTGRVGIGTTVPNGKFVVTDGAVPQDSVVGGVVPLISAQGSGPAYFMGKDLVTGVEFMFGTSSAGVAWAGSTSNHSFQLRTNNLSRVAIDTGGSVGIGTLTPSTLLHVKTTTAGATVATFESGTGSCTVVPNSGVSCSSDSRLKENVEEIINGLDKVLNLRGVTFQWKERNATDDSRHMGFIAQEVEKVAPELVSIDTNGYKRVNYANFVSVLTEAVKDLFHKWFNDSQDLHREIASVKAQSVQLKKDNELLKLENTAIKSYLCSQDPSAIICK